MSKSVLVIDTPKKCDSCMYVGTFHGVSGRSGRGNSKITKQ